MYARLLWQEDEFDRIFLNFFQMKIGIDASRYSHGEATGVEKYSKFIIDGIIEESAKDKEVEITLYSREPIAGEFSENVKNKVLKAKRFWTLFALSEEIRKNPPDVLFVPSHVLPLWRAKKNIITIHDVAFKHLRKAYSFFQFHYLNWSTKFAVKHAYKIIVPSEATKNDLKKFFKCSEEKIVVIPHGFNPPEFSSGEIQETFKTSDVFKYFGINENSDYVLFVGRLESKKNLERLVKAFAEFKKNHLSYRLILAGKRGVGFDGILKTINKLEIMDKVIMPGYITEMEKEALFKHCKIFAFPSLFEGFGLPILEAFHYKKPILTSKISCIPEVAGECVHYANPYDDMDISIGLNRLADNHEYAQKLIELGTNRLKMFSWKEAAKKTYSVLKS